MWVQRWGDGVQRVCVGWGGGVLEGDGDVCMCERAGSKELRMQGGGITSGA